jgi:hypothetical protein
MSLHIRSADRHLLQAGVKADVLLFDRKLAAEQPWTQRLWVYDLRTNKHFTLRKNPLRRDDLDDFVSSYASGRPRSERIDPSAGGPSPATSSSLATRSTWLAAPGWRDFRDGETRTRTGPDEVDLARMLHSRMARPGLEPGTPRFSVVCSTN